MAYPQDLDRERHWYDRLSIRGYTQFRYNGLFSSTTSATDRSSSAMSSRSGRSTEVKQLDAGIEWQYRRWVELTTELLVADRTTNGDRQTGHMLRLQLQFNF